jgi:hypothetical protein
LLFADLSRNIKYNGWCNAVFGTRLVSRPTSDEEEKGQDNEFAGTRDEIEMKFPNTGEMNRKCANILD